MQHPSADTIAKRNARLLLAATVAIMAVILAWHHTLRPEVRAPVQPGALVQLLPEQTVEDLFRRMVRTSDIEAPCPGPDAIALIDTEILPPGGWGCLRLVNRGEDPGVWRIDMNAITSNYVTFYVVRAATEQKVLTHQSETAVPDREAGSRRLVSEPVPLAGGETVEIWASFATTGNVQALAPTLRPEMAFDAAMSADAHAYGAYLGASGLLVAFFAAFAVLLRSKPARIYAVYFGFIFLIVFVQEGYLASLLALRPGLWTGWFVFMMGVVAALLHFRFVASFVAEALPGHPFALVGRQLQKLSLWLVALWILTIVALVVAFVLTEFGVLEVFASSSLVETMAAVIANSGLGISGVFIMIAALHALWASGILLRAGTQGAAFFAFGAVLLLTGPLLVVIRPMLSSPVIDFGTAFSFTLFADGLVFAAAIVRQTFGLRSQRDEAIEAELAASQEQLRLSETLLAAHQDLDQARRLAETHRTRLAHTSHDLRQPLMSLQLALKEADAASPALRERLSSGLDYLREVLSESMADGRPDATNAGVAPQNGAEPVPVSLLMANVARMFGDEARAKGLTLRVVESDLTVRGDPVALIRMLSNLVSNAVKYTDAGAVLIGPRRRDGAIALEVRDSGPGMTAEEVATIRHSYTRGAQSHAAEGEGIGLASVEALAQARGLSLTIRSAPGRGSCMAIEGLAEVADEAVFRQANVA